MISQENFWNQNAENWTTVMKENLIASRAVTNRALVNEILRKKPKSVLDLGCGEGWLSEPIVDANIGYLGIDGSAKLVEIASRRQTHFEHVPYAKVIADWRPPLAPDMAVFNFSLLEEDIRPLLQSVSNLLKADGVILIQTLQPLNLPVYQNGWNEEDFKSMTVPFEGKMPWYGRTKESWLSLFNDCGLKIDETIEPAMNGKSVSIIFILKPNREVLSV